MVKLGNGINIVGVDQMKKVLGISGSPVKNSNTDTLVKTILEATGIDHEFVKLSDIEIAPCRACKKCVYTNKCILNDDFKWLSSKIVDAGAVVIGTPVMYGNASAFTKAFVERLWSLRHVKLLTQGKVGATAVVGWTQTEEVSEWLKSVMVAGNIVSVGNVVGHGSPGCFTCGPGETCGNSIWNSAKKLEKMTGQNLGMEKIYNGYLEELPPNDPFENPLYNIVKCISVEDQLETMEKAKGLGRSIGVKLKRSDNIKIS